MLLLNRVYNNHLERNMNKNKDVLEPLDGKDLSRVKASFKSIHLQFYFEIAGLASAEKWREIENLVREECF